MLKIPAPRAISRVLEVSMPIAAWSSQHATCVTRRWQHGEVHARQPPMSGHVMTMVFSDVGSVQWNRQGKLMQGELRPSALTVTPDGQEGFWDISRPVDVIQVILSTTHADEIAWWALSKSSWKPSAEVAKLDRPSYRMLSFLSEVIALENDSSKLTVEEGLEAFCSHFVVSRSSNLKRSTKPCLDQIELKRVDEFIRCNLGVDISIDLVASMLGMSSSMFLAAYRRSAKQAVSDRILDLRVARAREMLIGRRDLCLREIALLVGYTGEQSLRAAFRKRLGVSPEFFLVHAPRTTLM